MKKSKPQYKIVKKHGLEPHLDRYQVYRKWIFYWTRLGQYQWSIENAEKIIADDKKLFETKKKKDEIIGYY